MHHSKIILIVLFLLFYFNFNCQKKEKTVMKLGEATQLAIGCEDIHQSLAFYQKLGFEKIAGDTLPYPWMQISDGSILLHLNQDGQKYMGLAYFSKVEKYPNPKCGIFGEFATSVKDLEQALAFWQNLGFEAKTVYREPYPWAILTDGMNILGLNQTKNFDYPAITYFAPDMSQRVQKLKEAGITSFADWQGQGGKEGNFILTTPEGQKIFLFSF